MKGKRAAEFAEKRLMWQEYLIRWESSGLTQVEFCRLNNLRTNIFLYWKKKLLPESNTPTLVEIPKAIISGSTPHRLPLCLVVGERYRIEITPGFDAETLDRLIRVLSRS